MGTRELTAEAAGTFALVLTLCGTLLFAPAGTSGLTAALAAGGVVIAMTAAFGPVSGAHLNPAITLGLIAAGRLDSSRAPLMIAAQCLGGLAAAGLLALVLAGAAVPPKGGLSAVANGYDRTFGLTAVFALETVATALLILVVVGMGGRRAPATLAPLAIGLATVSLYALTIPVSGGGLNPARSLATAIFGGTHALLQLWVFWVAPILGAVLGGAIGRLISDD
jgi:aquaporin Z